VLIGGSDGDDTLGTRHFKLKVGVVGNRHEFGIAGAPKNGVVGPMKPNHLKSEGLLPKVGGVPKQTGRSIRPMGSARFPGTTPWKPPTLGRRCVLLIPRRSSVWA
jgi:hypothetical protein